MKPSQHKWRLLGLFTIMTLLLAGCGEPFISTLTPAGENSKMLYNLMMLSIVIMVAVLIVVAAIYIYVLIRYRARKGDENKIPKQVEGNHKLEIIWTVIPILLIVVLAIPTVSYTFQLADTTPLTNEDTEDDPLVINVTAYQYWWSFEYEDEGIVTSQDLVIPTNERVYVNLKANDVIHSFWVPALAGKMDTNPGEGNINTMWLDAEKEGLYYGKCAELCGPSHALMDFKVKAVDRATFDQWVGEMQEAASKADTDLALAGEEIFNQSCIGCHAVGENGGNLGPNLTNFGDRTRVAGIYEHNETNVKNWLANNMQGAEDLGSLKPGNLMAASYKQLSDEELNALTEYLMNLKVMELDVQEVQ
jgi:cytochrome c oxidase subunit II